MKKLSLITAILMVMASALSAQTALRLYGVYTTTDFDEDMQSEAASTYGFGASLGGRFAGVLEAGIDFNMTATPWKFEQNSGFGTFTAEYTNMMAGAYLKAGIPLGIVEPYAKVGAGYYMGKATLSYAGESEDFDYKGVIGYSYGVGIDFGFGLYGEYILHKVDQMLDDTEIATDTFQYNNNAINVGWKFTF